MALATLARSSIPYVGLATVYEIVTKHVFIKFEALTNIKVVDHMPDHNEIPAFWWELTTYVTACSSDIQFVTTMYNARRIARQTRVRIFWFRDVLI